MLNKNLFVWCEKNVFEYEKHLQKLEISILCII